MHVWGKMTQNDITFGWMVAVVQSKQKQRCFGFGSTPQVACLRTKTGKLLHFVFVDTVAKRVKHSV